MKSTPYWTPSRSAPGTSSATAFIAPAVIATASKSRWRSSNDDVDADVRVVVERHAQPLDEADVHLDRLAREAERGHADEHRPAAERQAVVDVDAVALHRQLARDRDPRRPGAHDRDLLGLRLDVGHDVRDARGLVPLDEEALHRPDRERPVDVAAPAGALARRRADVRAHRRDRVRLAGEDVALLEPALGGEIQVAAAVRPDRAGLLALDVALEPGGVDRLDEELLADVEGQGAVEPQCEGCGRTPGRLNLPPARRPVQRRPARRLTRPWPAATLAGSDGAPRGAGLRGSWPP